MPHDPTTMRGLKNFLSTYHFFVIIIYHGILEDKFLSCVFLSMLWQMSTSEAHSFLSFSIFLSLN